MQRVAQPEEKLAFDVLAEIAAGTTARIELCSVREPATKAGMLVAVKRLHKHIAEDPQFADMFFDEVWMTAALHHQNVVDVVGWGTDREGTYLAVELVQGVSLARLMKTVFETGEMFSERMVVFLGTAICAGLSAAHQLRGSNGELLQLVHRDLTPGNVLISFNGQIKITDFGLAKAKQRVTKTLTGLLKGHPQYMAPEMARGYEIDSRADLFSLGVVLFELFTGQHPWSGGTELEIMRVTATDPPKDILALRPKLDRELANVVRRLLEKDPKTRFQSAEEVRQRLYAWLDAHGYSESNEEALGRFVRRNAMRQMRWFERAVAGELAQPRVAEPESLRQRAKNLSRDKSRSAPPPKLRRNRRSYEDTPDDEVAEITDVSAEPGGSLADTRPEREPRTARGGPPAANDAPIEGIDWGEEIPTVVQKKDPTSRALPLAAAAAATVQAAARAAEARLPKFPMADDESDNRTTSVKAKVGIGRGAAMLDPESDEVPTVPIAGSRKDALAQALASLPERRPRDTNAAIRKLPPPPPAKGGPIPNAAPSPIPALPPPPGAERDVRRGDARRADVRAREDFLAEADRLAVEALRHREDADLAARIAAHRARVARIAHDAAALAAEAARIAAQGGGSEAARMMEEARQLEETLHREIEKPESELPPVAPEPKAGFSAPSHAAAAAEAQRSSVAPPAPTAAAPAFAGAAAGLTTAHASIGGALPVPLDHERISAPPPPPGPFPSVPPVAPRAPTFPSAPPPAMQGPAASAGVTGPPLPAGLVAASVRPPAIPPEYSSNSRIRPTVVPGRVSAWEAFYRREILGFPAPVALVLAAVLLTSVIAAIAMLVR
jgi:serine/threonine-protein kinase